MNPDRIVYNGITIEEGSPYTLHLREGHEGLDIRTEEIDLTGKEGGLILAQANAMRLIGLEVSIKGATIAEYYSNLDAFMIAFSKTNEDKELKIRNWNGQEKSIWARIYTTPKPQDLPGYTTYTNVRVELKSGDPYFMDTVETSYQCGLIQTGGTAVPTAVPASLSLGIGGKIYINNTGDYETEATFILNGYAIRPHVLNFTTGKYFYIDSTIGTSDIIRVERLTGNKSVTLNTSTNYMNVFKGDYFKLIKGMNEIRFSASNYDTTAQLMMLVRNRYMRVK